MKFFSNWKTLGINGIIALLFGIGFIINPTRSIDMIISFIGILIITLSVISFLREVVIRKTNNSLIIMQSVAGFAIGLLMAIKPGFVLDFIFTLIGLWLLIYGGIQLYNILNSGYKRKSFLISSIIYISSGLVLVFFSIFVEAVLSSILGFILSAIGLIMIYFANEVRKDSV